MVSDPVLDNDQAKVLNSTKVATISNKSEIESLKQDVKKCCVIKDDAVAKAVAKGPSWRFKGRRRV